VLAYIDGADDIARPAEMSMTVPALSTRDLVDGVDLIKLDIEGMEAEVLRSIRRWILDEVPTLLVEVNDDARTLQLFLRDLIREAGYGCAVVGDDTKKPRRIGLEEATGGRLQARYGRPDVTLACPAVLDAAIGRC
jgi:hypothetical protein